VDNNYDNMTSTYALQTARDVIFTTETIAIKQGTQGITSYQNTFETLSQTKSLFKIQLLDIILTKKPGTIWPLVNSNMINPNLNGTDYFLQITIPNALRPMEIGDLNKSNIFAIIDLREMYDSNAPQTKTFADFVGLSLLNNQEYWNLLGDLKTNLGMEYDDAEIIKVGNPALRPQFTNSFELSYKNNWDNGFLFSSVYHKRVDATITRIGSIVPGSTLIYNVFQNAGRSYNTGVEIILSHNIRKVATLSINLNLYKTIIDSFSVLNKYPIENLFSASRQEILSGNMKMNALFHFPRQFEVQLTAVYQAPDLVPQGIIYSRFSIDMGLKKTIQKGRAELFINATDIANTLKIKKVVTGNGFNYTSIDYYETQVFRIGYNYKF
jgi:outer membrane receptor protein involved in Fe transport